MSIWENQVLRLVGNKAKRRISKRAFQENKAHQIFRKTNSYYPWYAHVRYRLSRIYPLLPTNFGNENYFSYGFKLEAVKMKIYLGEENGFFLFGKYF